jgi:flagellar basal-body rod protein FlgC
MSYGAFGAIDVAGTGMTLTRNWIDILSHNVANGEEPFRAHYLVARERTGGAGVHAERIVEDTRDPQMVYEPDHPFADADGYVTRPSVDLAGQMSDLIIAQRAHQANVRIVQSAREAYESSLTIGR